MGSLRRIGTALVLAAFAAGLGASWLWMQSSANWRAHKDAAYVAGVTLYHALQQDLGTAGPLSITPLTAADDAFAREGAFHRITGAPQGPRITAVPISADTAADARVSLAILSPDLVYPLASLEGLGTLSASELTGEVTRLLATYCSDPLVLVRVGEAGWAQIEGNMVWGCEAAPADHRLLAALIAFVALGALVTASLNAAAPFSLFAEQLRSRKRLGGPSRYEIAGPQELQDIVHAVNSQLESERAQIESRAAILSGVSHDLGTPATRLRLRTALIPDAELRGKLEADIDSMTGMIESVLTYTRAEMSAEPARKLSLSALVTAIVDDYQDTGAAVSLREVKDVVVQGGASVFMSRQGRSAFSGDRQVVIIGRPISLQRAITNLIDNALKYGRRANVQIETSAETATVIVDDEGSDAAAAEVEALIAPFKRGDNTRAVEGYGLGLTIVSTIANLHGGGLSFEDTGTGLRARLSIQRS